ncbi:SDR family oxidoreductase [Robiginitomaculum antarcticum]|uniref:SDR family oxidoreductase n=1 Tax=Robiginitomaculum antarcticum TaxID=437507 RepID=UPI0005240FF5|nr:SDR family NAD(P)-dependent oxidoreductase [Robiginitomaculum antarcticum]
MNEFKNKTAFITGAAGGIGLSLARKFHEAGANVMMADINAGALEKAKADLGGGSRLARIVCDVSKPDQVKAAADATLKAFGKVHIVVNNAGVGLAGRAGDIALEDWRWIVDINLMGVVYGVEAFTPLIRDNGEGGHILNVASMAGHFTMPGMAPYHATKFAVVGYSEALRQELAPDNINVTTLCPTWVKTNIYNAAANRPTAAKDSNKPASVTATQLYALTKGLVDSGMSPDTLADLCLTALTARRGTVFNDPEARPAIMARAKTLLADYDACLDDLGMS